MRSHARFVAGESGAGAGVVRRPAEAHGQEQRPGERRPSRLDGGRSRTGQEPDVAGRVDARQLDLFQLPTK